MGFDDDFELDFAFGQWLKDRRRKVGLSIREVANETGLPVDRIEDLESGLAERGVTHREASLLAQVYGVDPRAVIKRALTG